MKLLWKIKTDNEPRQMHSLFPPLIVGKVDTKAGPREVAILAGVSDNIYAIDVAKGEILWQKHFTSSFQAPLGGRGGGIEACRRIRKMSPNTGIVMIGVRDKAEDKVQAFEAGADDYVTKPFRQRELLARLNAVRRRVHGDAETTSGKVCVGCFELDTVNRVLRRCRHNRLSAIHVFHNSFTT
jgi:hypothetical protein